MLIYKFSNSTTGHIVAFSQACLVDIVYLYAAPC